MAHGRSLAHQKKSLDWLAQYVKVLKFDESEDIARVIRKEIYLRMRNTLMATRRGDLYYLQNHPTFSNWGRKNLVELAQAYSHGGDSLLRETLAQIFHAGWKSERPELTIIGFDENLGTFEATAIRILQCAITGRRGGSRVLVFTLPYRVKVVL